MGTQGSCPLAIFKGSLKPLLVCYSHMARLAAWMLRQCPSVRCTVAQPLQDTYVPNHLSQYQLRQAAYAAAYTYPKATAQLSCRWAAAPR